MSRIILIERHLGADEMSTTICESTDAALALVQELAGDKSLGHEIIKALGKHTLEFGNVLLKIAEIPPPMIIVEVRGGVAETTQEHEGSAIVALYDYDNDDKAPYTDDGKVDWDMVRKEFQQ